MFAAALTVSAQTSPFYVTGDLGGTLTENADFSSGTRFNGGRFPPFRESGSVKFDPGVRLGLAGGYHITDYLGVEAVSGMMASKIESISGGATVHGTYFSNIPLMAGFRLELPYHTRVSPYIGASAGGAVSVLDADNLQVGGNVHGTQSDIVFAYQAFGGIRYAINEHMGIGIEYHYFSSQATEWRVNDSGFAPDHFRIGGICTHSLSVAFQYTF